MSTWTDGYVSDIQYTAGFYRELSPTFLSFMVNLQGMRAPDPAGAFTYCELACGQGLSTNILAAAHPNGRFWGFDFNPAQVSNARRLASAGGLQNIEFGEESFEELARGARADLPKFDYITLHGIYSWISVENRRYLLDFIARHLKPGGVVYVSYNCMPGWASVAPLQRLFREHAALHPGRSDLQAESALGMAEALKEAGAAYFKSNPALDTRMTGMKTANRQYLAHEYLNANWYPLYHADVVREMDAAKLNHVGSATVLENMETFSAPEPVRKIMAQTSDPVLRETIKDYGLNQSFRRDIFVRGASPLNGFERAAAMQNMAFTTLVSPQEHTTTIKTPIGNAEGQKEIYQPIFDAFTAHGTRTIRELHTLPGVNQLPLATVIQTIQLLTGGMQVHPVLRNADVKAALRLNRAIAGECIAGYEFNALAAGRAGTGIATNFIEACAYPLLATKPNANAGELVTSIWDLMRRTNRKMVKDGQPVEDEAANLESLRPLAEKIIHERLPLWRRLGVI